MLRYYNCTALVVIMKKDRLGWAPQMTTPAAAESAAEWCSFGGGR